MKGEKMVSALWMVMILSGITGVLMVFGHSSSERYYAFSLFAIVAVLYLFALLDIPVIGYQVIKYLGIATFGFVLVRSVSSKAFREKFWTPGCILMIFWILIAGWAHRGQVYIQQDEFTHWGRAVKQLRELEVLPSTVGKALDYPSYPPGSTLFYAFWTWLGGEFNEGGTIAAANVFVLSCILPVMQFCNWKQWKRFVPLALICIMLPLVYYPGAYQDIYVDVLLGVIAAYALIIWFVCDAEKSDISLIAGALFILPLIKASGIVLGIMVLALIAMDKTGNKKNKRMVLCGSLASLLVAWLSWSLFTKLHGISGEKSFQARAIIDNISYMLHGTSPWTQKYQLYNFFRFITMPEMMGGGHLVEISYVEWLVMFAAFAWWIRQRVVVDKELSIQAKRFSQLIWRMIAATIIYAVLLYHLYLYAFEPWEAAGLHSFDRYMATVLTMTTIVTAALYLKQWQKKPVKALPSTMVLLICVMLFVHSGQLMDLTFSAPYALENVQIHRSKLYPPQYCLENLKEDDMIAWMDSVQTENNEFLPYIANRYEMMPAQLERPFGNLMRDTSLQQVREVLLEQSFDYVYCFEVDEAFIERYGSLFVDQRNITGKTMYKVIRDEDDVVLQRLI